jgi:type I restriction enzyme S subunit
MSRAADATDDLPDGWAWATLGELVRPTSEKVEPSDRPDVPYLSLEHIEPHTTRILGRGRGSDVNSTKAVFRPGDVLYGKLRPYLNKVAVPDFEGICSTDILVFPRKQWLDSRYLMHFLTTPAVVEFANHNSSGVQLPRIGFDQLATLEIPLPPLAEQRRIVAAVEAVLARVGAARDRLNRVPATLKRFRQAVLAAACSGRLTEDWRKQDYPQETATAAIDRLTVTRRELWERTELARLKARGAIPADELWKRRYKAAATPSPDRDMDLPEGWEWASVAQVARLDVGFAFRSSEFTSQGVRLLRGENLEPGSLRWLDVRYWPESKLEGLEHLMIEPGEIILALDRPIISTGLKIARAKPEDLPCLLVQRMMRFKMFDASITSYLFICLQTPNFVASLHDSTTGSDLPHITGTGVAEFSFPFPPPDEQRDIVRRVDALFALADRIEAKLAAARQRVERLTQAVLAKAFRGELVPTEADLARREGRAYEPASALLERIRAERAICPARRPSRRNS